eukprot:scaffold2220_cov75-Cylindrotheca_fusiformis.AAC.4
MSSQQFVNGQQRNQRIRFTLFTKILFKELRRLDDKSLYLEAQSIVTGIVERQRAKELTFPPFFKVVEKELRELVGEVLWRRAHKLMRFYLSKNKNVLLLPKSHQVKIGSHAA